MAQVIAPIMDDILNGMSPYGLTSLDASLTNIPNYYNCRGDIDFYGTNPSQVPALEAVLRAGGVYTSCRHPDAPVPESKKKSESGGAGGIKSRIVVVKDWKSQKEVCIYFLSPSDIVISYLHLFRSSSLRYLTKLRCFRVPAYILLLRF